MDPQKDRDYSPKVKNRLHITEKAVDADTESIDQAAEDQGECLEIRAAVEIGDDVTLSAETFRAYAIGLTFTLMASAMSNVTGLRELPLVVEPEIIQLVSLPVGRAWARIMPHKTIGFGKWKFMLNPGPFNIKEHALIVIMANVGAGYPPYAVSLLIVQMKKYSIIRPICR